MCGDISLILEGCSLDENGDGVYVTDPDTGLSTGILVSACGTAPIDTDGDGIPDYLDLDSDDEGCADNFEAGTDSSGTSEDTYFAGTVDSCGLLTSGISGTCPIPTNNSWMDNGVSDACLVCCTGGPDKDNDGVPDYADLDTDNDGILDEDEGRVMREFNVDSEFTLAATGTSANVTPNSDINYLAMAGVPFPPSGEPYINGYNEQSGSSGAIFTLLSPITIPDGAATIDYYYYLYNNILDEDDADHPTSGATYYTNNLAVQIMTDAGTISGARPLTSTEIGLLDSGNWIEVCFTINLPPAATQI